MSPQGVYPAADVCAIGDEISSTYEGRHVTLYGDNISHGTQVDYVTKGYGVWFEQAVGMPFTTQTAALGNPLMTMDTEGIWCVDVTGANDGGNEAVSPGQALYINTTTGAVSKIRDNATQLPFGYALGNVSSGATERIAVKVHWDPISHTVLDGEKFYFGDEPDITIEWTGQELLFQDDRTIDVSDGYNRTIHVSSNITMTNSRYAAVSCYSELIGGTAGQSASGGSFSLAQGTTKTVDGHFQAVMAEVKNKAPGCSVASALFCRWDNDSAVGFGGNSQSFIRFEDNSSATHVENLFDLYLMDATTAASATAIVCQAGNAIASSHVIKIVANGVPYWIMMDSTPPA